jgi:hypothetical protein
LWSFQDFLGFTPEEGQLAKSTAIIEAHSLELEGGDLLGKFGKKKENGKFSPLKHAFFKPNYYY